MKHTLLLLFTFFSITTFAGTLSGTVTDAKDGSALSGVVVTINNTTFGAQTDSAGHFIIKDVADGTYEVVVNYVTYKQQTKSVTITGDATLDIKLEGEGQHLANVSVRSNRVTRTEMAVLSEVRKSNSIVSGIGAAQIAKTMDRNAADVVKRIPGVSIQDDKYIIVRGLSERYNTVWLNDAGAPSSEVDKKAFHFDLIPGGLIDRILIFKTPSPELPGDFAGGMIKIYTTSLPAKTEYTIGIQGSYRDGSTGSNFNYNKASSTDWLGYDNGSRNIPAGVPAVVSKNDPNSEAITKLFPNDWAIYQKKAQPDLRINLSAGNLFQLGAVKLGNTFGLSYANTYTNYEIQRYDWQDTTKQYHYNDQQATNKVNLALMDNIGFALGNSRIEFKNLYNQIGTTVVTARTNVKDSDLLTQPNFRSYLEGYENRKTYSTQLLGSHHNNDNTRKYTWALGYTDFIRNQPDLRRLTYSEIPSRPGVYSAQVPAGSVDIANGGGKYYAYLKEQTYSFSHQFTQTLNIGGYKFDASAGNYIEYKKRKFDARELGYTAQNDSTTQSLKSLGINEIFSPEYVGGAHHFNMDESVQSFDHYDASNKLIASFLSLNLPVGKHIKIVGGARYEYNTQITNGFSNLDTIHPKIVTKYLLPSINAAYNFSDKTLLRLAYGETLNRPEFRESSPSYFYDFDLRAGTYGALYEHTFAPHGDTIKVAQIQNFDVRWEWYPTNGETVQIGAFYKRITNPIQQVIVPGLSDLAFTYANGTSAYVTGIEVDVRKNLAFLDKKWHSSFFKDITLVGNVALSKSQLSIDSARITNAIPKGPLQNQSAYIINMGMYYQNEPKGWQVSLLYNVYGPRLYAVGTIDDESIGELAFHNLELILGRTFLKHYTINAGVQNILGQSWRFVKDVNNDNKFDNTHDKPYSSNSPGRYFTLGVKIRF